jgi:hypothetical protein
MLRRSLTRAPRCWDRDLMYSSLPLTLTAQDTVALLKRETPRSDKISILARVSPFPIYKTEAHSDVLVALIDFARQLSTHQEHRKACPLVLAGSPGMGMSVLLRLFPRLSRALFLNVVPLYVPLRTLATQCTDLDESLGHVVWRQLVQEKIVSKSASSERTVHSIADGLNAAQKKLLVLLDDLDRVHHLPVNCEPMRKSMHMIQAIACSSRPEFGLVVARSTGTSSFPNVLHNTAAASLIKITQEFQFQTQQTPRIQTATEVRYEATALKAKRDYLNELHFEARRFQFRRVSERNPMINITQVKAILTSIPSLPAVSDELARFVCFFTGGNARAVGLFLDHVAEKKFQEPLPVHGTAILAVVGSAEKIHLVTLFMQIQAAWRRLNRELFERRLLVVQNGDVKLNLQQVLKNNWIKAFRPLELARLELARHDELNYVGENVHHPFGLSTLLDHRAVFIDESQIWPTVAAHMFCGFSLSAGAQRIAIDTGQRWDRLCGQDCSDLSRTFQAELVHVATEFTRHRGQCRSLM